MSVNVEATILLSGMSRFGRASSNIWSKFDLYLQLVQLYVSCHEFFEAVLLVYFMREYEDIKWFKTKRLLESRSKGGGKLIVDY